MGDLYILKKGVASLSDLVDGHAGYPGEGYTGTQYYVNNITGNSAFSGLSWKEPFAQVSQAVTASEAQRLLQGTSTNDYVRNQIFVQGTGTAYTSLTELPHYCDLIGVGADPHGNGAGIARIGADTGTGENGVLEDASVRGLNVYNIQFQAGNGGYAFKGTNLFRSVFRNVVFATNGSPAGAPAAGFEMGICGGVVFRDCLWANQSSIGNMCDVGINITGTHFHTSLVENCYIGGADAGVAIAAGTINGYNSVFRNNMIGWGSETCAIGVDDNATAGHIMYTGNFIAATTDGTLINNGALRWIGNFAANGFSAVTAS